MADVIIVCVRKDMVAAESLAEMFEAIGLSVSDGSVDDDELEASGAAVLIWSEEASHSAAFLRSAQRMIATGKAVVASLTALAMRRQSGLPVADLSRWSGNPGDPRLDTLCARVNSMALKARARAAAPALSLEPVERVDRHVAHRASLSPAYPMAAGQPS